MRGRNGFFRVTVLGLAVVLFISGCESFFTSNAFSGLQRDPANMSAAELEIFAADALASGDRTTIKKTFDALLKATEGSTRTASQTSTLVELGVAATGIPQLLTAVVAADGDLEGLDADALLSGFDSATAKLTADIALAADPGTLTGQQYAYAALGLVGAIGAEAESFEALSGADGIDDAQTLLGLSIAAYEAEGKEDSETYQLLIDLQGQIT
ncbi:MAG: hypothetical protein EA383_17300 [Spirochaetaceae bacterium]|nr:MAG: hypothetical protein EA383_17300 [Spirochaetaceae bacterium]